MLDKVCKVLRGVFVVGWLCANRVEATTCTATSVASLANCLNNVVAGDTIVVKGIESGITTPYRTDGFTNLVNKNVGCGSQITIKPFGYSGAGTGDTVFIDGVDPTANSWTQCVFSSGVCQTPCDNIPGGQTGCLETWYQSGTSPYAIAGLAIKADGSPTYTVLTQSDMTNSHSIYNSKRCYNASSNNSGWMACDTANDCPSGFTCTSTSPEADSYTNGSTLWVRITGQIASAPTSYYIQTNSNAVAFYLSNSCNITIEGFKFRMHGNGSIYLAGGPGGIIIDDITSYYHRRNPTIGADYAIVSYNYPFTLTNSNLAYSMSELIHTEAPSSGVANPLIIHDNWLHHAGDARVLGVMPGDANSPAQHTPGGMIMGNNCAGCASAANYTGTQIYKNLFQDIRRDTIYRNGQAFKFENVTNGTAGTPILFYSNVFVRVADSAISFEDIYGDSSYIDVFNNLIIKAGIDPNPRNGDPQGPAIAFEFDSHNLTNINIFNNTVWSDNPRLAIGDRGLTGTNSIIFRNNLLVNTTDSTVVNWTPTSTANKFDHNLIYSSHISPLIWAAAQVGGVAHSTLTCTEIPQADTDASGATDSNRCDDPGFYDSANFLFYPTGGSFTNPSQFLSNSQFGGSAIDMGTSTGNPAAHTTGIVNTIATQHGFGFYSDSIAQNGTAWDAGAVEAILPQDLASWTTSDGFGGPGLITQSNGFKFTNTAATGFSSMVPTFLPTLTAGKTYTIAVRLNDAGEVSGGSGCAGTAVNKWTIRLDNIEPDYVHYYGTFDATTGRLTGLNALARLFTSTPSTIDLRAQNNNPGACPLDTELFFTPVIIIPASIPGAL